MNLEKIFEDYIAHEGRESIQILFDRLQKTPLENLDWEYVQESIVDRFKEFPQDCAKIRDVLLNLIYNQNFKTIMWALELLEFCSTKGDLNFHKAL